MIAPFLGNRRSTMPSINPDAETFGGPLWSVRIDDFGKIGEATIEMSPLVILVGKNNTGKSYIASLLWALLNFEETFLEKDAWRTPPSWFAELIEKSEISGPVDKLVPRS